MRRVAIGSVFITLLTSIGVMSAPPAQAATCDLIYKKYFRGGEKVAEICDSNPVLGAGSFTFQSRGQYRGVRKFMSLKVCTLVGTDPHWGDCVSHGDQFYEYVGPIPDPGGCLRFDVVMWDGAGTKLIDEREIFCN